MNKYQMIFKRIFIFVQLILIAFVSVSTIAAQTSSVDLSFNPIVAKDKDQFNNTIQTSFILQPDGKILIYGGFQVINGVVKNGIAQLNPDGSLDSSFNCAGCDFSIGSAVLQADGKIIVAGSVFSSSIGTSAARLKRLNADGIVDSLFNPTSPFNDGFLPGSLGATVYNIQPDGKILVVVTTTFAGTSLAELYRLNTDGTLDNTFNKLTVGGGRLVRTIPVKISSLPNGKILIATTTFSGPTITSILRRYNADGSTDSTFEMPTFGNNSIYQINDFETFADGSIVVVGKFDTVNAASRVNIVKLQPAGNVDLSFAPTNVFSSNEAAGNVEIYPNGKLLVATSSTSFAPPVQPRLIRYNSDGSIDNTFTSSASLAVIRKFVIDSSGSVFLNGDFMENGVTVNKFARLNADGGIASSFSVNLGIGGSVAAAAVQADGKILIGGDFTQVGNVFRRNTARLNTDGTVDQTFNPQLESNYTVNKIVVQADGKILLGGSFTVNNVSNLGLIRLNPDGSLDTAFKPVISNVRSIMQQPDGKILVGGSFTGINGQPRAALVRLNSDGTTDSGFNAMFANGANISNIILQSDGKIIAGGSFSGVNGFNRSNLVRLNGDGSLDSTFIAGNIPSVLAVEPYPNGKYIVSAGNLIIRLNNDGTNDTSFQSPNLTGTTNSTVFTISVQPDGTIIIGGSFTPDRLARLRADGTVDTTFLPVGANDTVRVLVRQTDGKLFVGGDFTMIANVMRLAAARLNVEPVRAKTTLFDFDGDGKADLTVFRPSNGFWYELRSQNNSFYALQFGQSTDKLAPADYDGDGRADIAVFRENVPGAGDKAYFYITNSSDNTFRFAQFGTQNDLPMSGDWDGDGKADLAVYREAAAGGQSFFFYRPSSIPGVDFRSIPWGAAGDKPVRGDFDGDGKLDAAVFRPSNGIWYILQSSNNQVIQQPFGLPTDILVPADYDGDGKTNIAVFRPSNGFWYTSLNPQTNYGGVQFGISTDLPVPADYDGDGKADIAVFRPSNGSWYLLRSTNGFTGVQFGAAEDRPIPNSYVR